MSFIVRVNAINCCYGLKRLFNVKQMCNRCESTFRNIYLIVYQQIRQTSLFLFHMIHIKKEKLGV